MPHKEIEDILDTETILERLGPSSVFSGKISVYERVESTNLLIKEKALEGAVEGTVIVAEEQTAGKGRLERQWLSPAYVNLLLSILLRPSLPVDQAFVLTMILATAVTDVVKALYGLKAMIKWPNDIYIKERKLGGILTEFSTRKGKIEYVILGLGLNVNWNPGDEEGILYPATSVLLESGVMVSRNELLATILIRFEDYYRELLSGRVEGLYKRWRELSMVTGKEVDIHSQGERITGMVLGIDPSGALIIRDDLGRERRILSGDVSLRI